MGTIDVLCISKYFGKPYKQILAERAIRPLVITRKISGGSRSRKGAKVHAINMSVIQTMKIRKQSLINALEQTIIENLCYA